PDRFDPGRGTDLGEIRRVVGALSAEALDLTISLYAKAKVPTHQVEPVEVAEASKLLENSFRLVNISFINEFAELCRRLGIVAATYNTNYPDARASAALAFARGLAAHHDVVVYDPIVDTTAFHEDLPLVRELPRDRHFDAVVIAVKHKDTDVAALRQLSPILMDLVRGAVEATESISSRKR